MASFRQLCIRSVPLFLAGALGPYVNAQSLSSENPLQAVDNQIVTEAYQLFESGEPDAALAQFETALDNNSEDLSARLGQAMVFADLQRHEDAFESYDVIVRQHPKHAFAWNGRGLAAFNMEDFDEALHSFVQATAEQPVNGFYYESLAWTQMCRGEYSDAVASAKTATLMYNKKRESSAYPLLIAYFAYIETGDLQNAQTTLRYAVQNKPLKIWPAPVIDYLVGNLSESDLISSVTNTAEETEAHTYIGLHHRSKDEIDKAMLHLDWVARNGDPRVFEYTLSRALQIQDSVALFTPSL